MIGQTPGYTVESLLQDVDFCLSYKPVGGWPIGLMRRFREYLVAEVARAAELTAQSVEPQNTTKG